MSSLPRVSFAIPVFNSAATLAQCLEAIVSQAYPAECMEIIVADGGSTDETREIARRFSARLLDNPKRTGEAGKAVAMKAATGDLLALVDSDNFLPDSGWLKRMVEPFSDPEIVASEPWEFTWRAQDPAWTRYCALVGANDPLCVYLGNYDRFNHARGNWTQLPVSREDCGGYLKLTLDSGMLPTMGANGFLVRRSVLTGVKDYLFDVDLLGQLVQQGYRHVAKVKVGIVHLYAQNRFDFSRKQRRRVYDYLFFQHLGERSYPWKNFMLRVAWFSLATVLVFPTAALALRGFFKKRDWAWWLHPLACWITLWIYGSTVLKRQLGWKPREFQRQNWNLS